MVQSIYLDVKRPESSMLVETEYRETFRDNVMTIINLSYPLEVYNQVLFDDIIEDDGLRYSVEGGFALKDVSPLISMMREAKDDPDEKTDCNCKFCSSRKTVGGFVTYSFGIKITDKSVGRNIWGDVGYQDKRLRLLYAFLKHVKTLLERHEIKADFNLSNVNENVIKDVM